MTTSASDRTSQLHDTASLAHFDSSQSQSRPWTKITALPDYARPRRGLSRRALNRACSFIAENLGERFTLEDLARQAGEPGAPPTRLADASHQRL